MTDNKIQTQVRVSSTSPNVQNPYTCDDNGNVVDGYGRICGSVDCETGVVSLKIPPAPPINPVSGKPYFKINENAWDGEWVAGEVQVIPSSAWGGDDE